MTPLQIAIGGLALMVGLLALARQLGGWQNKPLARCLNITAAGFFVAWCFLLFPTWVGWAAAAVVWSIVLWFIFLWFQKSVDDMPEVRRVDESIPAAGLEQKRIAELNQELFSAREHLANARNELSRRDARVTGAEAQRREEASLLNKAPKLWVDYKPETGPDPAKWEALMFSREGDVAIRTIQIEPLIWTIKERRYISLHSVIGPLRAQPIECKFTVSERTGNAQTLYRLPAIFREMMRKFGPDTQPSVDVLYEDFDGNWFCRTFVLSIDPFDRIVWEPGAVRLAKPPVTSE